MCCIVEILRPCICLKDRSLPLSNPSPAQLLLLNTDGSFVASTSSSISRISSSLNAVFLLEHDSSETNTLPPLLCQTSIFGDCKSSKVIAVAVLYASAIIHGDKLSGYADKFVSVREFVDEVRDPVSRQILSSPSFLRRDHGALT